MPYFISWQVSADEYHQLVAISYKGNMGGKQHFLNLKS